MSAPRGRRLSALAAILASLALAAPSLAQVADAPAAVRAPFYTDPNPLWRSPALIGMGRLTLAEDRDNDLDLWDFARNPAGIYGSDTTSTIELRPGVATSYAEQVMPLGDPNQHVQTLDARQGIMGYEAWRRTPDGNAYGFYGDMTANRYATPYDDLRGLSDHENTPGGTLALNGKLPFLAKGHMSYALRGTYVKGKTEDVYSLLAINPTGIYLDRGGDRVAPPDQLTPVESKNTYVGLGGAVSYRFGRPLTLAIGGDYLEERMSGRNEGFRYRLETTEKRPYGLGQATALGKLGSHLEWIADGRTWQAADQNRFDYSLSAGITNVPLEARGLRYNRFEEGSQFKGRVRWLAGALDLGGQLDTWYQRVRIGAPDPLDETSYNAFLGSIVYRTGADSLVIPDSIRTNTTDVRGYDYALGGSIRSHRGARFGAEYHWLRSRTDQATSGPGPQLEGWDFRTGFEYPCAPLLRARGGFIYRRWDADKFTSQNEFVTRTVTTGLGVGPANLNWSVEAGYSFEWGGPDYDEPYRLRGHQQQLALQLRWSL